MTPAELKLIEDELDIELPSRYLDVVSNYPAELLKAPDTGPSAFELLNYADEIIRLNRYVDTIHDIELEAGHFLIGHSGCGDYYFIDLEEDDSPVYFWNHDIGEFDDDEQSDSLLEHASMLLSHVSEQNV